MATETMCAISQIGETAGQIWGLLSIKGTLSMTKIVKEIGGPRDTIMQAIGWLAREDKIHIDDDGRNRTVCLR